MKQTIYLTLSCIVETIMKSTSFGEIMNTTILKYIIFNV